MFEFKFPDVGEGIAEGEILRWLVKEGDRVGAHQPVVEMETDKAAVELPAPCAGIVRELRGQPGDLVPVGTVLLVIEEERGVTAEKSGTKALGVVGELEEAEDAPPAATAAAAEIPRALPKDRKLAAELGVDLAGLKGAGTQGRITEEQIRAQAAPATAADERLPLKGVRRSMAKAMVASAFSAVHVSILEQADAQELRQLRNRERALAAERGVKLTDLAFIVKALTLALERFPLLNSHLDEDRQELVLRKEINIGFAVDTPEGLLVPVVRNARRLSILDLAAALQGLSERSRNRTIAPAELKGGTFTVSNYGAIGGIWGTPIINPPQSAILGIGRIAEAAVVRHGQVVARTLVPLSLTFDHRIIDGATATRFLNSLIEHIEKPDLILLEN